MHDSSIGDALADLAVLRQRAARLAHEPDRGVRHRLAAGGTQERGVRHGGRAGVVTPPIVPGRGLRTQSCDRPDARRSVSGDRRRGHRPTLTPWQHAPTPRGRLWHCPRSSAPQSRRCVRPGCAPRCSARRCRRPSGSRPSPPRCPPTSPSTATTSAPGASCCCTTPPATTPGQGTFRCVAYARAEIDPEMANDPLLGEVGWSLADRGARRPRRRRTPRPSGTVTKVSSESFGGMAEEDATAQLEIRASWTPVGDPTLDLDPARRGLGRAAVHRRPGCRRCPRASPSMPSRRGQRGPRLMRRPRDADRTAAETSRGPTETPEAPPAPLLELRDGLPPVVDTARGARRGRSRRSPPATGPVAIDAERASGYRYSARAYLIQLRREGAGTALVDPIPFDDLTALQTTRSATPSGSCTPPPRTCRA